MPRFPLLLLYLAFWPCLAADSFSPEQRTEIEAIVSDYVASHPEIIVRALQKLEENETQRHAGLVRLTGQKLREDPDAPRIGGSGRRNYIVDIFDFNCGFCKVMEPLFARALEEYDLQLIYVDLPVVAESSRQIGVIAQAVYNLEPDKYFQFHRIFMSRREREAPLDFIRQQLEDLGVAWDEVLEEMRSGRPQEQIARYLKLGAELGVRGTPYLIINGSEFRGAIQNYEDLRGLLR